MTADLLARLATLPDVGSVCEAARGEVDKLLFDRVLISRGAELAGEAAFAAAQSAAVLEGAEFSYEGFRDGSALDASPMGRVADAALRVQRELPALVDVWRVSPRQALARLHAVAAVGFASTEELGRPRSSSGGSDLSTRPSSGGSELPTRPSSGVPALPDDPLRLGAAPDAAEVASRMELLVDLITRPTEAPALVVAGVVHAELAVLRPFTWGSGLVARAAGRLTLAARILDPDFLVPVEAGIVAIGRPKYVAALRGFATGQPEGLAAWLIFHADAVAIAARQCHARLRSA